MVVEIRLLVQELTYHEFEIKVNDEVMHANCYLTLEETGVILRQVDIEGPGASVFGSGFLKIVYAVAKEIAFLFDRKRVEIHGAKRTTGKTKGKIPRPIIIAFDKL